MSNMNNYRREENEQRECRTEKRKSCLEEIQVNGVLYKIDLQRDGNCARLFVVPCTLPSAVFEIARICELQNRCTEFEFFEATVFTDPVETIIDCDFCQIVRRAIELFIDDINLDQNCGCRRFFNGLF